MRAARLAWLPLSLALAGCPQAQREAPSQRDADAASVPVPQSLAALEGSEWRLIDGLPGVDPATVEITLAFEGAGRIGGSGGCNQYGAEISDTGGGVRIGPVMATKRGCARPRNQAEVAYFGALSGVTSLRREGGQLLLGGGGHRLRFEPVDASVP